MVSYAHLKKIQFAFQYVECDMGWHQGWGEYSTYEYEYWKISTRVVLEYNVFSIFMFIILGKTSTRVVFAPALVDTYESIRVVRELPFVIYI